MASGMTGVIAKQMWILFLTCLVVHFARIFFVPFVARLSGNDDYTETEKIIHLVGIKPRGPCSLPRPVRNCTIQERIHLVLVSAQWEREPFTALETEVVIKSILSTTRCKVMFHFMVAGETEEWGISSMMEELGAIPYDAVGPIPPRLVRHDNHERSEELSFDENEEDSVDPDPQVGYMLHPIPVRWIQKQANLLGINITHHSGEAGFAKLYLSQILYNVKRAIYLDVDMLFAEDIGILWSHFNEMDVDKELLLFMGDNHPTAYGPRARYPFCSCQLIMDLERLREANLTRLILESFGDQKAMDVWGFRPGDQWVWTMMCMNNPEKCKTLPKIWNVSGCAKPRFMGLNARERNQNGTCWKVVHFNCMGVRDLRYYALRHTDWEDTLEYMKQIPWTQFQLS